MMARRSSSARLVFLAVTSCMALLTLTQAGMQERAARGAEPTKTPVRPPGWTPSPTPVNEDFLPAVFREEGTPMATLPPGVTPTLEPSKTAVPPPR